MWQSKISISNTRPRWRFAASAFLGLLLTLTISTSSLIADESGTVSRRVHVTCDCYEKQPATTLITQLGDHNLTLSNFRAVESQRVLPFTVDAESGAVCTTNDDQLDFESQREFQFQVLADEEAGYDEFLAEFSAGLVDAGLPEGDLKRLSVSTIVFDITVRVNDVSELPVFEDSHFSVELISDAPVEIGCVTTNHQTASAGWLLYIASGNEDGIFELDPKSGVLTLVGNVSCNSESQANYELQLLIEDSAGEIETANVFVDVLRNIPVLVSESTSSTPSSSTVSASTPATSSLPEVNPDYGTTEAPAVPGNNKTQESIAKTSGTQESPINTKSEETENASNINTLPNINEIELAEVKQWVGDAEKLNNTPTLSTTGGDPEAVSRLQIAGPASNSLARISFQDSPGYLLTIGAFSIFLMACIAVILIWSRAAAARAQKLEDEASEERLKAALNGIQQDEEIRLLKSELADRDQTIAQLKKELRSITNDFESEENDDFQAAPDRDSRVSQTTMALSDSRLMKEESPVASQLHRDPIVDARTSLGNAFEQIGRELARESQLSPSSLPDHDEAGVLAFDSTEAVVATLDEHQDLRSELADLFAIHGLRKTEPSKEASHLILDADVDVASDDSTIPEQFDELNEPSPDVPQIEEQASEDLHLDTVKIYLAKLLERSQDATSPESILVDRRKTTDSSRSVDRRAKPESSRPPVKSYLDAYMSAHGGELASNVDTPNALSSKPTVAVPSEPLKPRPPVDVDSIRESMNSFRVVAIQSSEHALVSHLLREAKAKLAGRTVMVAGLACLTVIIFLANMKHVINFSYLNWLMCSLVLLSAAELGLRIRAVLKQRRNVTSSVSPPRSAKKAKRLLPGDNAVEE